MNFFKKMSIKVKLFFGFIFGMVTFIAYLAIKRKIDIKDQLKYRLSRLRSEIEITNLEKDSNEKLQKLERLQMEEQGIRKKILDIEAAENNGTEKESTLEELDDFFDKRGF